MDGVFVCLHGDTVITADCTPPPVAVDCAGGEVRCIDFGVPPPPGCTARPAGR
jgi:hypothetical protein